MSENSKIEWTDHTFNPWEGCTKVSPGCLHCYAESRNQRWSNGANWGKGAQRRRTSADNWKKPLKWNTSLICPKCRELDVDFRTRCLTCGVAMRRQRVFCASLADWLDDEVSIEWLADLLSLIHATPNLDWLLLTKRPENWRRRLNDVLSATPNFRDGSYHPPVETYTFAANWLRGMHPCNIWIGTSVEDQTRADERIPLLLQIPAAVRFLSCEPLLSEVSLRWLVAFDGMATKPRPSSTGHLDGLRQLDWVICGGESGPKARAMHPDWARSLRDQCVAAGVPFLFKQWGEWAPATRDHGMDGYVMPQSGVTADRTRVSWIGNDVTLKVPSGHGLADPVMAIARVGKKRAGRRLDGREWNEFPQ